MQTEHEVQALVDVLLVDFSKQITGEVRRLLTCEAIDLGLFENDFSIPKVVLSQALHNIADSYRPLSPLLKGIAKNLRHF